MLPLLGLARPRPLGIPIYCETQTGIRRRILDNNSTRNSKYHLAEFVVDVDTGRLRRNIYEMARELARRFATDRRRVSPYR